MNKIDCKIVLEEYVLLHQAYENQEFKRLLPILEQHTCVHTHDAELRRQALLVSGRDERHRSGERWSAKHFHQATHKPRCICIC